MDRRNNSIQVIQPYKYKGQWVFDDTSVGLLREPFVAGTDRIIDEIVSEIPNAHNGFILIFSSNPFPTSQTVLEWKREESGGNWYYSDEFNLEGWLCPAMYKYFHEAPAKIYIQVNGYL